MQTAFNGPFFSCRDMQRPTDFVDVDVAALFVTEVKVKVTDGP